MAWPRATIGWRCRMSIKKGYYRHDLLVLRMPGKVGPFSSYGEDSASESLAQTRQYLFALCNTVCSQKCNPAGGFANLCANRKGFIGGAHPVGGEGKSGGQSEGFLRGQH